VCPSVRKVSTRIVCLSLAGWLGACDKWPVQRDAGGPEGTPAPSSRDASSECVTVSPVAPSPSPQVNGALCFGIAHGSSQALQCAQGAASNLVDCVDGLLGDAFVVRWTGDRASVHAGLASVQIGSIAQVRPDSFDVATSTEVEGLCTLRAGPPPSVEFCLFE